ncbi:MAG: hypothetical protein M0P19_11630, partial [Nevskia sp.]|nr:hypothetical protein [Nevskia sp.]
PPNFFVRSPEKPRRNTHGSSKVSPIDDRKKTAKLLGTPYCAAALMHVAETARAAAEAIAYDAPRRRFWCMEMEAERRTAKRRILSTRVVHCTVTVCRLSA